MSFNSKPKVKAEQAQSLLSLDFILLFLQATCCNCYIAVFYCLEQWMVGLLITPSLRGLLLAVLAGMVFVTRPITTYYLYGKNKTLPLVGSIVIASLAMLCYPLILPSFATPAILALRAVQGVALAIYSSCTISLLIECIPKGQSARGFALFSLTLLLPYAILPAIGEELIILLGNEARLFAATSLLGLPALLSLPALKKVLKAESKKSGPKPKQENSLKMWQSVHPRDLGLVYLACLSFSIMTNEAIFFMKGLCQEIAARPSYFFTTYTTTIMVIRLLGNTFFDRLPRYPVILGAALTLALATYAMATTQGQELIFLSILYGLALGLLYPLLAALVCDRSSPKLRALNTNLMMTAFDLSSLLAPILGGLMLGTSLGYRGVFYSASFSVALCGFSILLDYFLQKHWPYSSNC